jgi:hypothetical protein
MEYRFRGALSGVSTKQSMTHSLICLIWRRGSDSERNIPNITPINKIKTDFNNI